MPDCGPYVSDDTIHVRQHNPQSPAEPESISRRRDIICFDFDELVENTALLSPEDRNKFSKLKTAMRNRDIAFSTIETYYLLEEVYFNL